MTTRTLVCEICREGIATFDQDLLTNPLNLRIFKSLYPDRMVADPFPPALDDWRVAVCPRCRRRPFLNFYEHSEGKFIITTGEVVPDGGQWFVMALQENDSGLFEKVLLSTGKTIEPATELPPQEPQQIKVEVNENVPAGEVWFVKDGKPQAILTNLGVEEATMEVFEVLSTEKIEVEPPEEDQEPEPTTGNYKSPPVNCPGCGKQFRSAGRMAKYHQDCPATKIQPPREGFKI